MERSAGFSRCRRYRYWLHRRWSDDPGVVFIGLNPSAADAQRDDPTLRRIMGFARDWGFGQVTVVNLFAWRAKQPAMLRQIADPVGPRNDYWLRRLTRSVEPVVVAWGNDGSYRGRDRTVLRMLAAPLCLGVTTAWSPRHPLYAKASCELQAFSCPGDSPPSTTL